MDKHLQVQPIRAGPGHLLDFVHAQFPWQNDPADPHLLGTPDDVEGLREGDVGQRGEVQFAFEARFPRNGGNRQVLQDETVRLDLAAQAVDQGAALIQFIRLDQGVEGDVNPRAPVVGEPGQGGHLLQREILGGHPGGKILETAVHGIGAGGKGRQKRVPVACRRQNGGRGAGHFIVYVIVHVSIKSSMGVLSRFPGLTPSEPAEKM